MPRLFLPLFSASTGLSPSTGAGLVAEFGAAGCVGRLSGG